MSASASPLVADPIFDRAWWVYSLCRERLFADHTDTIAAALEPVLRGRPQDRSQDRAQDRAQIRLLEVGCGPGFYSRRLAARFPSVQAMGVDTSEQLLAHARLQAHRAKLGNCSFLRVDAEDLHSSLELADAAIASRLFLILRQRDRVLGSIFETLRPGGVFFVAEPISALRTAVPLWMMRTLSRFASRSHYAGAPIRCRVMSPVQFRTLLGGQPWSKVEIWQDKRYQYALCEKAL